MSTASQKIREDLLYIEHRIDARGWRGCGAGCADGFRESDCDSFDPSTENGQCRVVIVLPGFEGRASPDTLSSMRPRKPSSSSRDCHIFCQTPAACQSRRRRQQVVPLPPPISWGRYSHGIPLLSTNGMPVVCISAEEQNTLTDP